MANSFFIGSEALAGRKPAYMGEQISPESVTGFIQGAGVGAGQVAVDWPLGLAEAVFNVGQYANPLYHQLPEEQRKWQHFPKPFKQHGEEIMESGDPAKIAGLLAGGVAATVPLGMIPGAQNVLFAAPVQKAVQAGIGKLAMKFINPQEATEVLSVSAKLLQRGGQAATEATGAFAGGATSGAVADLGYNISESTDEEGRIDFKKLEERTINSAAFTGLITTGHNILSKVLDKTGFTQKVLLGAETESKKSIEINAQRKKEIQQFEEQRLKQEQIKNIAAEVEQEMWESFLPVPEKKYGEIQVYKNKDVVEMNNSMRRGSYDYYNNEYTNQFRDEFGNFDFSVFDAEIAPKPKTPLQERIGEFFTKVEKDIEQDKFLGLPVNKLLGVPLLRRLSIYHPRVAGRLLEFEGDVLSRTTNYLNHASFFNSSAETFLNKPSDVLNYNYNHVNDLIFAGKYGEAKQFLQANDAGHLVPEVEKMQNVLKEIYIEGNRVGLPIRELPNYFPHEIKDFNQWVRIHGTKVKENSLLQKILQAEEKRKGSELSDFEKAEIINRHIVNRSREELDKMGHLGERVYNHIDSNAWVTDPKNPKKLINLRDLYYTPEESFKRYVQQMAYKIEKARLFNYQGPTFTRDRLASKYRPKELTTSEDMPLKKGEVERAETSYEYRLRRLREDYNISTEEAQQMSLIGPENYFEADYKIPPESFTRPEGVEGEILEDLFRFRGYENNNTLGESLNRMRNKTHTGTAEDVSMGKLVNELYSSGEINETDIDKIAQILKDRFSHGDKDVGAAVNTMNSALHLLTLGQFKSTFNQLLDYGPILARTNPETVLGSVWKQLRGKQSVTRQSMGFDEVLQAYKDPQVRKNFLDSATDKTFATTGFKQINEMSMENAFTSDYDFALHNFKRLRGNKKPDSKFVDNINEFKSWHGEDAANNLYKALENQDVNDPTLQLYLLQQMIRGRYLFRSQGPGFYNDLGPVGSLVYALQKTAKVVGDELYGSFMRQAKQGKPLKGVQEAGGLAFYLGATGYTAETLRRKTQELAVGAIDSSLVDFTDKEKEEMEWEDRWTALARAIGQDKYFSIQFQKDPILALTQTFTVLPLTSLSFSSEMAADTVNKINATLDPEVKFEDVGWARSNVVRSTPVIGDFIGAYGKFKAQKKKRKKSGWGGWSSGGSGSGGWGGW